LPRDSFVCDPFYREEGIKTDVNNWTCQCRSDQSMWRSVSKSVNSLWLRPYKDIHHTASLTSLFFCTKLFV
jgi:hypothetical protein